MNLFKNDENNTYYLKEIPGLVKQNDYLQKEYNNQTGFIGRQLIENPWLSDNTKLNLIETAKPQYKKEINFIKSTLPYVKKGYNINKKYFSNYDKDINDQHKLYLNNFGGRKKRKSKKLKKNKHKILKNKSKKRKFY